MWKSERVRNEFLNYFRQVLPECVGGRKFIFDYKYEDIDKSGNYIVDCLIHGMTKDVHIYAVNGEIKAKNAAISMFFYNTKLKVPSCAILDSDSDISLKSKAQLTDVSEKIIDSLDKVPHMLPNFLDKVA